jgi:hypothetical protein
LQGIHSPASSFPKTLTLSRKKRTDLTYNDLKVFLETNWDRIGQVMNGDVPYGNFGQAEKKLFPNLC